MSSQSIWLFISSSNANSAKVNSFCPIVLCIRSPIFVW
jgi:hypothetical protein